MNIAELKNYGRSFFEILYDLPEDIIKLAEKTLIAEVKKDLGYLALAKLGWKVKKEISVRTKQDWSSLQLGVPSEQRFLEDAIKKTALMKVLADMVGQDKAASIHRRFYDRVADDLIGAMFPSVDDFAACGDAFVCLKDYCRSTVEPNRRADPRVLDYYNRMTCLQAQTVLELLLWDQARQRLAGVRRERPQWGCLGPTV